MLLTPAKASRWLVPLASVALLAVAAGCGGRRSEGRPARSAEERAVPVRVVQPEQRSLRETIDLTTTVEADIAVDIFAKITGRCTALHVDVGDAVAPGALLVSLDDEEARLNERQAFVRYTKAKQELERAESMRAGNLVSAEAFDLARLDLDEAGAAWELAKVKLADTRVVAPVGGRVVQRQVRIGDLVTPQSKLVRIVDFTTLEAHVHVPEYALPTMRVGLPALVTADALPEREVATQVSEVSPIVDPASGTVEITVTLPADAGLLPGMFVRVALIVEERPDTVVLPAEALLSEAGGYSIYVVRGGRAVRLPVSVGLRDAGWVEILGDVDPAEDVVTEGLFRIEPNTPVRIVRGPAG